MEESYGAEKIPSSHSPREYWEDSKWANDHFADIVKDYANLWVAIVDQKIVAVGKVISVVRKRAQEQTGRKHFPVIFAEKGIHVYAFLLNDDSVPFLIGFEDVLTNAKLFLDYKFKTGYLEWE